jgi:hypothetical protein
MADGMIGRRGLLLAGGGLVIAQGVIARGADALPVPAGDELAFRVMRHGNDIGRHQLTFARQGEALNVRIAVDVLVTFLSIPLARYTLRATESWQGTTLIGLSGQTTKMGSHQWMNAQRTGEDLVVTGSKTARYVAPPHSMGITYWNKRLLDGPMISMEDGVLALPKVTPLGPQKTRLASGATITTSGYNVKDSFDVDVCYDQGNTWASLTLTAVDGSEILYERL